MPNYLGRFVEDLRFQHPCALLVSGTTGAGKSNFVKNIIERRGIKGRINTIYYFMPKMETLDITPNPGQKIYYFPGLPTEKWVRDTFHESTHDSLVIIDDQWSAAIESEVVSNLTTFGRRHDGISIIMITQNFYEKAKRAIIIR